MSFSLGAIWMDFVDFLLPRICHHCGERITETPYPVCRSCEELIMPLNDPVCGICGQGRAKFKISGRCESCPPGTLYFSGLTAVTPYKGVSKYIVEKLKYDRREEYARLIAVYMVQRIESRGWGKVFDLIVPVPLFHARERERGFNQALEIALEMQICNPDLCILDALKRIRATTTQTRLSRAERIKNIKGAFTCKDVGRVNGKRVLIIDDVGTTCSTLNECARVLIENGATEVRCAVFARADVK